MPIVQAFAQVGRQERFLIPFLTEIELTSIPSCADGVSKFTVSSGSQPGSGQAVDQPTASSPCPKGSAFLAMLTSFFLTELEGWFGFMGSLHRNGTREFTWRSYGPLLLPPISKLGKKANRMFLHRQTRMRISLSVGCPKGLEA